MAASIESGRQVEGQDSSEVLNTKKIGSIIISASPGRGSTTVARELEKLLESYEIPVGMHMIGELRRRIYRAATGQEIIGPHERDSETDRRIDSKTRTLVKKARPEKLLIIEGQNAAVNAFLAEYDAQRRGEPISPHFSALIVCDPEIAGERVWGRERERAEKEGKHFTKTVNEVIAENEARHRGNLNHYWDSVPFLAAHQTDPHNPQDENALALYNGVYDSSHAPAKFIATQILVDLIDRNAIEIPKAA